MPFPSQRPAPQQAQSNPPPQPQQQARPSFGNQRPGNPPAQQPAGRPSFGAQRQAAPPKRSPFAGIENAQVTQRNPYLGEGNYILKIKDVIWKDTRGGDSMAIIESEVVISSYDAQDPATSKHNREGTTASICITYNDSFLSNRKEFIIAASGFDADGQPRSVDDVVSEEEAQGAFSGEAGPSPYQGSYLYVVANDVPTRAGGIFTRKAFHPVKLDANGQVDLAGSGLG
jgi:hypothetical protein